EMSRDVLTVGSTMRILLLYRGEYSQWVERFMNYLEEQTDEEVMINSIKNGDQPLPRVTQVSIAGTTSTEQPPLKDKSMWSAQEKRVQKIDQLILIFCPKVEMSRDVLTVGSIMRIPLLYRGEYSQWVERFMNYLEEQTDGEEMINSIKNGDQPSPRVTQVSISGTSSTEQPPLKDKSMDSKNLDKINEKGDACIFAKYSTQSRAYRVYNKRTRVIVKTIHVNFDELPLMASDHDSSEPVPQCLTTALEQNKSLDILLNQLEQEIDGEMCMFALIVSQTELKNIKKAIADSAWIEAM
nr:hypothetical protein [Tanacetum cinerariifolium]